MKQHIMLFLAIMTNCQQSYGIMGNLGGFFEHPVESLLKRMFARLTTGMKNLSQDQNNHSGPRGFSNKPFDQQAELDEFDPEEWVELLMIIGDPSFDQNKKKRFQALDNIIFQKKGNRINVEFPASISSKGTILHMACSLDNANIISFLLEHGARHDFYNENGNLPVHVVNDIVSLDVLRTKLGADIINLKNKDGKTLLDIIEERISKLPTIEERDIELLKESHPNIREEYWSDCLKNELKWKDKQTEYATYLKSIGAKRSYELK